MADGGAVNFFIDATDDPLLPDMMPSFEGGQFSNLRANLLQQNQSKVLGNCDIDRLGKLRTRRGTIMLGNGPPSGVAGKVIQGLTSYQTPDVNYIVAANNKKLWKFTGSDTVVGPDAPGTGWVRIATGGVLDLAEMLIYREGKIDRPYDGATVPVTPAGYTAGTTVLKVKNVGYVNGVAPLTAGGGVVGDNEKLYFVNNLRTDYYEYTIASHTESGGPPTATTEIVLEEPGLVFDVKDGWKFIVARPARVNHGGGYPGGYTGANPIVINGYTGTVNTGESFIIKSENIKHTITTASGSPTTSIDTWKGSKGGPGVTPGVLQDDWVAATDTDPVVFAQGLDMLFFCDGVGPIYGWKETATGGTLQNLSALNTVDYLTGSNLGRAATAPPTGCHVLLWFQNRLIASGIAADPDAIFFSDFFDATSWDRNYQLVRIGGGESDPITGCLAWTDLNMLVFKKNSCYLINLDPSQNPNPDDPTLLTASFAVKQLHKLIGCPAPMTAVQVGGGSTTPGSDVLFVDGDKKVHSIRRVMAAETQQEVGQAISLPIQDVLDTINLEHIDKAVAMYHNEHYILGFPSMKGADGGTHNNGAVAYNLLTQSWCGVWSWAPTCFSRRTDLGSYSKLILGDWRDFPFESGATGRVLQWMDDISLDEETDTSYEDLVPVAPFIGNGSPLRTTIVTRAFTGGDMYSYKTGFNVEFEFDESVAACVVVKVILDKIPHRELIAWTRDNPRGTFDTLTEPRLRVPFRIPVRLPDSPGLMRRAFDLQRYGMWRELQFQITTNSDASIGEVGGKLAIRSIRMTFFMDTMQVQTIPVGLLWGSGAPDVPDVPEVIGFTRYAGNPVLENGFGSPPVTQVADFVVFENPLDPTQMIAIFAGVQGGFGIGHIFYATSSATDGYSWTIGNGDAPIISTGSHRVDSVVVDGTNIKLYSTRVPGTLTDGIDMFEQTFTGLDGLTSWTLHSNVLLPTGTETEVSQGAVLKDGSTYYLYYSYRTASATLPGIRVCTSPDGLTWTRANGGADIISRGAAGTCDHTFFEFHQIQKLGSQYIITCEVYGGPEGIADGSMWTEAIYFSNNPTSDWQASASNPVFSGSGVAGDPDRYHVATPSWAYINGTWRLFYQASDTDPFTTYYISAIWTICESTLTAGATPANLIPTATTYDLSGPSSGAVSVASTDFTISLPPGYVLPDAVIVTPNDSGGGGTFMPAAVVLSTASPSATFSYTPTAGVTKTVRTTNDGGLTNPASLNYAIIVPLVDGDLVSSWTDSSGNGNHAVMTGSNRPTFKTAIVNGKSVVRFTVAGVSKLNLTTPISGASPWIVFIVAKRAGVGDSVDTLDGSDVGAPRAALIDTTNNVYLFSREGYMNCTAPMSVGFHIIEGVYYGVGIGNHFVLVDGVSVGAASLTAGANTGNFTTIGYDSAAPRYSNGDIAEIIIYNLAIPGADRQNIEKYLGTKYGLTVPAGTAVQPDTVTGLVGWWKADSMG